MNASVIGPTRRVLFRFPISSQQLFLLLSATMALRKKTSTTRLPESLREQICGTSESSADPSSRPSGGRQRQLSRKDSRKLEREGKKQRKATYYSSTPQQRHSEPTSAGSLQQQKSRPELKRPLPPSEDVSSSQPKTKKQKISSSSTSKSQATKQSGPSSSSIKHKIKKTIVSAPLRTQREREDDAYIAYLESKLGPSSKVKGKKKATKGDDEDGLEGIL